LYSHFTHAAHHWALSCRA